VVDLPPDLRGEEEAQFLEAVAWVEITSHPRFAETFGRKIKELLADANRTVLDWRRDKTERDVAVGRFEALADVDSWSDYYAGVVEVYRRANVEDHQKRLEDERAETSAHPERGEAWYEKND
jgi:hypothetical protein